MNRIKWYFKQLLPMTYRSHFKGREKNKKRRTKYFSVWKMWLGKCYKIDCVKIK